MNEIIIAFLIIGLAFAGLSIGLILRNKPINRKDDQDLKDEEKKSSLGAMGLKPKIVH